MTGLLASVRNAEEAALALAGGADIIDLKEPSAGALGAVDEAVVREVVRLVAGRRAVSVTVGDLPMDAPVIAAAVAARAGLGADLVKVGFLPSPRLHECIEAAARGADARPLVAVFFADCLPVSQPADLPLQALARSGFAGVMLDTAVKDSGGLLAHAQTRSLAGFVAAAQALGLVVGLAGSLRVADVERLLPLGADYLGFRGGLCADGRRTEGLDAGALAAVRSAIPAKGAVGSPERHPRCRGWLPGEPISMRVSSGV